MANQNSQFGIKEVMNFTICEYNKDVTLAKPFAVVDYAQVTGLEHSADRIYINGGRGNKRLLGFDHTKVTTLSVTLPLVDFKLLSKISGDEIVNKISKMFKAETKMVQSGVTSNYIVLEKEPLDNTLFVNILSGYRELEDSLEVVARDSEPDEGQCAIKIENGEVRLLVHKTTCPAGTEIRTHYTYTSKQATQKIIFSADKFPKFVTIKGDTLFRNQVTTDDEVYNFIGYKGQFQTNFTFSMSATEPTVLELTLDLYAHKDKETQEELYYEFVKEEDPGAQGTITLSNVPDLKQGITLKTNATFTLGLEQEYVSVKTGENTTCVTIKDNVITGAATAGTGKIILSKFGYNDLEVPVTVEATRSSDVQRNNKVIS